MDRWIGRTPRMLAAAVAILLCAVGLRALIAPRRAAVDPPAVAPAASPDLAAEAFAQAFVRVYLTWSPAGTAPRDSAVGRFAAANLDPGAGLTPPPRGRQAVTWTAVAGDARRGATHLVTVLAGTTGGTFTLAVPVARDPHGLLAVTGYPALIGPPPSTRSVPQPDEQPVNDPQLKAVAGRTLADYLALNAGDLPADLTPDAVVVLPAQRLRVARFDGLSWVSAGRSVAAVVEARRADGLEMTLRYELGVVRRAARWFVSAIETTPNRSEVTP